MTASRGEQGFNAIPAAASLSGTNAKISSKHLLFDRRYGWVYDEWKNPSEEALAGGRGMFCIVPLAKGFVKVASHSINAVTGCAIQILERPDNFFSPQKLQANLQGQIHYVSGLFSKPKTSSGSQESE